MKQNGKLFFFRRQTSEYLRKLLLIVRRHDSRIMVALLKNTIQNMNEAVTVFLIHVKSGGMILLKRVVFQVNQQEEQPVLYRGKRAVFVEDKASPVISVIPVHIVICKILIMSF
jgi:hypothetical protein